MMILCSASPRRAELLTAWGIPLAISPADILEQFQPGLTVEDNLRRITAEKLRAGRRAYLNRFKKTDGLQGIVALAADTIVHIGDKVFGKPANRQQAMAYLQELSGRSHQVTTGFAFYLPATIKQTGSEFDPKKHSMVALGGSDSGFFLGTESSRVTFNDLSGADCENYIEEFRPFDKAGSYGIQDKFPLVRSLQGSFSNVVGLPMNRLLPLLGTDGLFDSPVL